MAAKKANPQSAHQRNARGKFQFFGDLTVSQGVPTLLTINKFNKQLTLLNCYHKVNLSSVEY